MKKITLFIVCLFCLTLLGCSSVADIGGMKVLNKDKYTAEETSAIELSAKHVQGMDEFKKGKGENLTFQKIIKGACKGCYDVYTAFLIENKDDPAKKQNATVTVLISDGIVDDAFYASKP